MESTIATFPFPSAQLVATSGAGKSPPKKKKSPIKSTTVTKVTKLILKPKAEGETLKTKLIATKYSSRTTSGNKFVMKNEESFRVRKYGKRSPEMKKLTANKSMAKVKLATSLNRANNTNEISAIVTKTMSAADTNEDNNVAQPSTTTNEIDLGKASSIHGIEISAIEHNPIINFNSIQARINTAINSCANDVEAKRPSVSATSTPLKSNARKVLSKCLSPRVPSSSSAPCTPKNKRKSYDPEKARSFIKEQQNRRKEALSDRFSSQLQKDAIKKRLMNLQKNSLKIVGNNVKRARTKSSDAPAKSSTTEIKSIPKATGRPINTQLYEQNKENNPLTPAIFNQIIPKYSDRKRIGILRRVEDNQNIENVISPILAPSNAHNEKQINLSTNQVHNQSLVKQATNISTEHQSPDPFHQNQSTTSVALELDLRAPASMVLKSTALPPRNEVMPFNQNVNEHHEAVDQNQISFWLKPTPVQPYPYNFIMAVRKKLEAIAHPVVNRGRTYKENAKIKTLSGRPNQIFESRYKTNLALSKKIEQNVYAGTLWSHIHDPNRKEPSAATDDLNSNFFSSFEAQRSNISMQNDKKSSINPATITTNESGGSQNTLSISSGILSHSSPEKKKLIGRDRADARKESHYLLSPLSTDAVDGMHIILNKANPINDQRHQHNRKHISSHIKFARGVDTETNHQHGQPLDVHKMLNDFNESLSQVIQVNRKLHSALSSPSSQLRNTASSVNYSDDFDEEHKDTEKRSQENANEATYTSQFTDYRSDNKTRSAATPKSSQSPNQTISEQIINNSTATKSTLQNSQMSRTFNATLQRFSAISTNGKLQTATDSQIESIATQENDLDLENRKSVGTNGDNLTSAQSIANTVAEELRTATETSDTSNSSHSNIRDRMVKSYEQRFSSDGEVLNTSIGSDMLAVFNRTSMEISNEHHNSTTWSEGNISYSSLGMFEQLIQTETQKTKHLSDLLKLREKSLIDRFKGQIAWLELRKQKMKEHGQMEEITAIKKKQRALLLRLEKDRQEIHRLMKLQKVPAVNPTNVHYKISHLSTNMSIRRTSMGTANAANMKSNQAMKAIEIEPGTNLEKMLQKRENDLRNRREQVERLLQWHQRLDDEEHEVHEMEQLLMLYCGQDAFQSIRPLENVPKSILNSSKTTKKSMRAIQNPSSGNDEKLSNISSEELLKSHKHIQAIENSLKTLQNISSRSAVASESDAEESVQVHGKQLNRLWRRLTGRSDERYVPSQLYVLCKTDLERIYEDAKLIVLERFNANREFKNILDSSSMIEEQESKSIVDGESINVVKHDGNNLQSPQDTSNTQSTEKIIVPEINLNFSPETSIKDGTFSRNENGYYFKNDAETEMTANTGDALSSNTIENDVKTTAEIDSNVQDQPINSSNNVTSTKLSTHIDGEPSEEPPIAYDQENDDIYSDITEDSLNNVQNTNSKSASTTIHTAPLSLSAVSTNRTITEENEKIDSTAVRLTNEPVELETTQLIDDISFPNLNITSVINQSDLQQQQQQQQQPSHDDDTNATDKTKDNYNSLSPDIDDKYISDEFESIKTSDKTILSDNNHTTNSKSDTIPTEIPTARNTTATITTNSDTNSGDGDNSDRMVLENTQFPPVISRSPSPSMSKELEQRLIDIDDSMKDLRETISRSPVLELAHSEDNSHADDASASIGGSLSENSVAIEQDVDQDASIAASIQTDDANDENKENETNLTEKLPKPDTATAAPVLPTKIDMKARGKKPNESYYLDEIYPKIDSEAGDGTKYTSSNYIRDYAAEYNKVPQADALRPKQTPADNEVKSIDPNGSFPFLREIPNKPPPPYPTNRHPVAPILPSDDQIKEIVYNRIKKLYTEFMADNENPTNTTYTLSPHASAAPTTGQTVPVSSLSPPHNENSSNIYERIFLNICDEFMADFKQQQKHVGLITHKQPLAFYNPPNRLHCMQDYVVKRIHKLLGRPQTNGQPNGSNSFDGWLQNRKQPQIAYMIVKNRRKRDLVDEILIQELMEDEHKWTNFDIEEMEVQNSATDGLTYIAEESIENTSTSLSAAHEKMSLN